MTNREKMLKVAENLKCKHGLWCVSVQNEKTLGAFVCQLNYKECKDVCERFVNKWKEWERQRDENTERLSEENN